MSLLGRLCVLRRQVRAELRKWLYMMMVFSLSVGLMILWMSRVCEVLHSSSLYLPDTLVPVGLSRRLWTPLETDALFGL